MSAIGSGIGGLNIAGSVAGAQRTNATADQARAEGAEKAFQIDATRMTAQLHGDVAEADLSTERDADGRMPYEEPQAAPAKPTDDELENAAAHRAVDASGVLGTLLDLEA